MFTLRSALCAAALGWSLIATAAPSFIAFESGPVRPIALSPDGTRLAVANIPDNRVEFFAVDTAGLTAQGAVAVGLEPVALAFRDANEVWVVNHLSDSISIVRLDGTAPRVARTLLTGDEPRDIVFAGTAGNRAFVTTAHRGQQRTHASIASVPGAGDPRLTTAGTPRADVWVFDADNLGHALGGTPLRIVQLFGDTPRALATSPDRSTVYAAVHFSGNQTTVVSGGVVCPNFSRRACTIEGTRYPGGSPGPARNKAGAKAPHVSLIVKWNAIRQRFEDEIGRNWNPAVRFRLPDKDVFAIDAAALTTSAIYTGVGTTLFNMAVNPINGALYVSNTEANNLARFEGPGEFAGKTVQGKLALSRITIIDDAGVQARHLNTHIDYNQRPAPATVADHSLSTPLDMVVTSDGATLYVAAFGSSKVGVIPTAALTDGSFDPASASADYIEVTGGGPSGLALDEANQRLFVLTRFDNAIKIIDLASGSETASVPLFNPEPETLIAGRPMLYDARRTSSNGEASCASCHVFGDFDQLAWDLGNPDDRVTTNPIPVKLADTVRLTLFADNINGTGKLRTFHPMKGPMTTQTLRGMVNHGAMHWRGDRANGEFGRDARTKPPFDARLSFRNFIVAFEGLLGQDPATPLPVTDMDAFTDFALALTMPPNPVRRLDNSLTSAQARGRKFYFGCDSTVRVDCSSGLPRKGQEHLADGVTTFPNFGFTCHGCHTLTPKRGFFGGDGQASIEFLPQIAKIPHLRNAYQKRVF
ncbi:MAG: hypothetical protein FJX52_08965, partial [Alphaproteobacteria bacterium]|nr:hypothetical protein [Alphaproteobacteria bacterium]